MLSSVACWFTILEKQVRWLRLNSINNTHTYTMHDEVYAILIALEHQMSIRVRDIVISLWRQQCMLLGMHELLLP